MDDAATDVVLRRSHDGGAHWTDVELVVPGLWDRHRVAGNLAPVQDRGTGRIWLPFNRGNYELWITFSDDGGATWAEPRGLNHLRKPWWTWVGFGPPGGVQLRSGRLLIPAYASSFPTYDNGLISSAFVVYSDDQGLTWQASALISNGHLPLLRGAFGNENQVAETEVDGELLMNSRTLFGTRLQSRSSDGGITWTALRHVGGLPQPLEGCEGSLIALDEGCRMLYSGVNAWGVFRTNLTVWASTDCGESWAHALNPDERSPVAGYSSMAVLANGTVALLWERRDTWFQSLIPGPEYFPNLMSFRLLPAAMGTWNRIPLSGAHAPYKAHPMSWQVHGYRAFSGTAEFWALLVGACLLFLVAAVRLIVVGRRLLKGRLSDGGGRFTWSQLGLGAISGAWLGWDFLCTLNLLYFWDDDAARWTCQAMYVCAFSAGLCAAAGVAYASDGCAAASPTSDGYCEMGA